jgi:hypothetical protein
MLRFGAKLDWLKCSYISMASPVVLGNFGLLKQGFLWPRGY